MTKKRIACACGASVASSVTAKYEIDDYLKTNGVENVEVFCCKFNELDHIADTVDLIVAVSKLYKQYGVPVINGLCYLTGVGMEDTNRRILEIVTNA